MKEQIQITERDKRLFEDLLNYGSFKTSHIAIRVFNGINSATVLRRLRSLEQAGLIARIPGVDRGELAWHLEEKGASAISSASPKKNFSLLSMDHDLKLLDIRLALERENISGGWIPEFEIRRAIARKHGGDNLGRLAIPDGLIAVRNKDDFKCVAIELELNLKTRDRYFQTFRQYQRKRSIGAVWYLVGSLGLGKSLEKSWNELADDQVNIKLLWSLADEILEDPLNAIIYLKNSERTVQQLFQPANLGTGESAQMPAQQESTQPASESSPTEG
jgi:hypothetical protein